MLDGILSQEEIDALLRGEGGGQQEKVSAPAAGAPSTEPVAELITDMEKDVLGEIGNISMGTSATTLSTLLRHKVNITTPQVKLITRQQLQSDYPLPYLLIEVNYTQGLSGSSVLIVKKHDAAVIADLMMGGDGTNLQDELDEIKLSAVTEAMNQMMGSATTSLSSMFDRRIDIAPPVLTVVDFVKEDLNTVLDSEYEQIVQILFKMTIEGLVDSEIMQIIPLEAARRMVVTLTGGTAQAEEQVASPPQPTPPAPDDQAPGFSFPRQYSPTSLSPQPAAGQWHEQAAAYGASPGIKKDAVTVQPVQFAPLTPGTGGSEPQNISLIMDVPLNISVELGRTKKTIKEILELGPGSIIQLEKLAGEPVDLLVNGKLIAKGEVVVIDENYGVRVTAIISPMDRMSKLQ